MGPGRGLGFGFDPFGFDVPGFWPVGLGPVGFGSGLGFSSAIERIRNGTMPDISQKRMKNS